MPGRTSSTSLNQASSSVDASSQQVNAMPLPPTQYISVYTDDNVRRGRIPAPPQPITDSYKMFGVAFHLDDQIIRPLENQNIRRLYAANVDHKRELKKLNHSVLVNFLELLDILIKSPGSGKRKDKIDDLNLLFINMHHLINEFRPHQARETLIVMLENQNKNRAEVADRFQKQLENVEEMLQGCLKSLPGPTETESKLLEPTEQKISDSGQQDTSLISLDRLMCHMADELSYNIQQ